VFFIVYRFVIVAIRLYLLTFTVRYVSLLSFMCLRDVFVIDRVLYVMYCSFDSV
jgi:hypothetical protein